MLDMEFVRSHFPALATGYCYMDNAGGSQTLDYVADRIRNYLLTTDVQLGASYNVSLVAGERVREGVAAMRRFINAADDSEVVMGASTSLNLKILSICLARGWQPGDEIIVTDSDHEANVSPWTDLQEQGLVIKTWKLDPETLRFRMEDLDALLSPKTRLVAICHVSNLLGTVNPIKEITERVHDHGALVCVDGVAYAPHRAIDVRDWDVDFYAFSCYKVYGPHYALLYGKKELLEAMPGFNLYFIKESPYKFQPGNVNFEFAYGMAGLNRYLAELAERSSGTKPEGERQGIEQAFDLIHRHEDQLSQRFLDFLRTKPSVRILGEPDITGNRVPTFSFVVDHMSSEAVTRVTDPHQIGIRFGDFYAKKLVDALNLDPYDGVVRVSMVHYNTLKEVDRLIRFLDGAL